MLKRVLSWRKVDTMPQYPETSMPLNDVEIYPAECRACFSADMNKHSFHFKGEAQNG
jgi:hypothetical protein